MHQAGRLRSMRPIVFGLLLDSERVHIRAKQDRTVSPAALQCADDAGPANALRDIVEAEGTKTVRDERARPMLVEAELGMAMKILPPRFELRPESIIA
jgi:hypothetical protein